MPKSTVVDLHVILDVLLERAGYAAPRDVIQLGERGEVQLYVSAHAATTFAYLLENAKVQKPMIGQHVDWLLTVLRIIPVDDASLKAALASEVRDYEDAMVERGAIACGASVIITRNERDFKNSSIRAITPEKYLKKSVG